MTALARDEYSRKKASQRDRVYVLVHVEEGRGGAAVSVLRRQPGVVVADSVEAQPNVIMVVEAPDRRKPAELTIRALVLVKEMTKDIHLMPAGKI
ncbi:MAG: hypothetical protein JW753_11550 [Dehalococcoidia bacterium]|nr:hypothetical protein [Dehalococcoidia bacterium]